MKNSVLVQVQLISPRGALGLNETAKAEKFVEYLICTVGV